MLQRPRGPFYGPRTTGALLCSKDHSGGSAPGPPGNTLAQRPRWCGVEKHHLIAILRQPLMASAESVSLEPVSEDTSSRLGAITRFGLGGGCGRGPRAGGRRLLDDNASAEVDAQKGEILHAKSSHCLTMVHMSSSCCALYSWGYVTRLAVCGGACCRICASSPIEQNRRPVGGRKASIGA